MEKKVIIKNVKELVTTAGIAFLVWFILCFCCIVS